MTAFLSEDDHERITALLLGRRVTKVDGHHLELDNGTKLFLPDTDGGCDCPSGCYDLTELNGTDSSHCPIRVRHTTHGYDHPSLPNLWCDGTALGWVMMIKPKGTRDWIYLTNEVYASVYEGSEAVTKHARDGVNDYALWWKDA